MRIGKTLFQIGLEIIFDYYILLRAMAIEKPAQWIHRSKVDKKDRYLDVLKFLKEI